jgi:UDP-N-acetylmuramyl tripeptide synthase
MLWKLELGLARAAGSLSRLTGRGGGTTLPGKILTRLEPQALARLAAGLPEGVALLSATNGKTTTAAMVSEILRPRVSFVHNRTGANLVSGITSTLLDRRRATRPLRGRRVRLLGRCDAADPRAVCLRNLFRDQLDRYGGLAHRRAVAGH